MKTIIVFTVHEFASERDFERFEFMGQVDVRWGRSLLEQMNGRTKHCQLCVLHETSGTEMEYVDDTFDG